MASSTDFDAALVLSRFGLGANSSGVVSVGPKPRDALKDEIVQRFVPMPAGDELKSSQDLLVALYAFEQEQKAERERQPKPAAVPGPAMTMSPPAGPMEPSPPANTAVNRVTPAKPNGPRLPQRVFLAEVDARFNGTIRQPVIGFGERLAMFWANHFAVAVSKGQGLRVLAGAFEREAIRPHIFGRFADMLLAVETHPAMLLFLDNQQSVGPDSKAGINRKRGLNENLARETLELHTLGVDGGYTQTDVTDLARIITGWTVVGRQARLGEPGTFVFNPNAHEPGSETLLGHSYADTGIEQGRSALRDLARHPATATHIATKLARYFVADVPPPSLVQKLAATFTKTDGDLSAVYLALIGAEEAWNPKLAKVRSPLEYIVALLRATDERPKPNVITNALNAMGQPFWSPSGPNGYSDTTDAWASSEGLSTRIDVAGLFANAAPPEADPRRVATDSFGALLSPETLQAVSRAETRNQGLAIAFLSPEFQRR
jgi:uncharacterized protein (DUF1800 family)